MSKSRTDLKSALRSLDVSKPLRIPPQLGFAAPKPIQAVEVSLASASANSEESGSSLDTVQNEQSPNQTVSRMDSVRNGSSQPDITQEFASPSPGITESKLDGVQSGPCSKRTESKLDSVQNEPRQKRTGSKMDTVEGTSRGFTRVPHALLRDVTPFEEPIDFMIYMHFFTYSYGWDRETASMGLSQLERYTKSGRNTVKRALERLQAAGWIECVEEYEHARMSRKWRVKNPWDGTCGPNGGPSGRGSKLNPVQNGRCPESIATEFKMAPLTGSKMDPFIESSNKEPAKNSLSRVGACMAGESRDGLIGGIGTKSEVLSEYFAQASMTPRKRQSEMQAYQELRVAFSEVQISVCLRHLQANGLPSSGEPCHSPMAFLSKAMGQVLALVDAEELRQNEAEVRAQQQRQAAAAKARAEQEEEQRQREREEAFVRAFPTEEQQAEVLARYAGQFGAFVKQPGILRRLAIGAWGSAG